VGIGERAHLEEGFVGEDLRVGDGRVVDFSDIDEVVD
jgi:hypothetical protein